jgi:hypothetical protein
MGRDALNKIEYRKNIIQQAFDKLWEYCESKDFYNEKEFKEYMMWVQHEVSRGTWGISYYIKELNKTLDKHVET